MNDISTHFEENELAYLGITGKLENPLRDKIAFRLQKNFGDSHIVAREWNAGPKKGRADMAILDRDGNLKCLVEIKAYSAMIGIEKFGEKMLADVQKSKKVIGKEEVENVFIFFANRVHNLPESKVIQKEAIKYAPKIRSALNQNILDSDIISNWQKAIPKQIKIQKETIVNFYGGNQYGVDLNVLGFLYLVQ